MNAAVAWALAVLERSDAGRRPPADAVRILRLRGYENKEVGR